MHVTLLALVLCCFTVANAGSSPRKLLNTRRASTVSPSDLFNDLLKSVAPALEKAVGHMKFKDTKVDDIRLTNLRTFDFDCSDGCLSGSISNDLNSVSVDVHKFSLRLHSRYKYHKIITIQGQCDFQIKDTDGKASGSVQSVSPFQLGNVAVTVNVGKLIPSCDGLSGGVINAVVHLFQKKITNMIKSAAETAIKNALEGHSLLATTTTTTSLALVTFDGASSTTHTFAELNDPVMGGQSTGTFKVSANNTGVFSGTVNIVPKLKAPGFIEAWADDSKAHPYTDVSAAINGNLVLEVRSNTPDYQGFHVSFAAGALVPNLSCASGGSFPLSGGCYKAPFTVPKTAPGAFTTVKIPFSSFTDKWSPATGKPTKQDPPTAKALSNIQAIGFWGEGTQGKLHLEIVSVSAEYDHVEQGEDTETVSTLPPKEFNTCHGPLQKNLRYNISSLGNEYITAPVPVDKDETLADAIACDVRTQNYAEPQFLFQLPTVNLYQRMNQNGTTHFYDSQCGALLFTPPSDVPLQIFKQTPMNTDGHRFVPRKSIWKISIKRRGRVGTMCIPSAGRIWDPFCRMGRGIAGAWIWFRSVATPFKSIELALPW